MAAVLIDEGCEIPDGLRTLGSFRRWATSPDFPERGRVDWVSSRIEVDMSPEDLFTHGGLKVEVVRALANATKDRSMHVFTGETRVSSVDGDVSAEPDVVVVSEAAFDEGRVRLVPSAGGKPDRYVELEGGVDLIVEIVSDSSVAKDTRRLPAAYRAAGVREYWLLDARGDRMGFVIHRWDAAIGPSDSGSGNGEDSVAPQEGTESAPAERPESATQFSAVLNATITITRSRNPAGRFVYHLQVT